MKQPYLLPKGGDRREGTGGRPNGSSFLPLLVDFYFGVGLGPTFDIKSYRNVAIAFWLTLA